MSTDHVPSRDEHAIIGFVRELLAMPGSHVNLECCGGRRRLRFKVTDAETGATARKALELPHDDELAASIANALQTHRQARSKARIEKCGHRLHDERQWRRTVRKRLLALCPHGRVVKRRIALVFELAADLGYGFLEDFIGRRPWLAKPSPHTSRR